MHVESEYGFEMLQSLLAAVAPGSLWPVDVLLRVSFSRVDPVSKTYSFFMLLNKTENLRDATLEQRGTRLSISFFPKFLVEAIGYIFLKKKCLN